MITMSHSVICHSPNSDLLAHYFYPGSSGVINHSEPTALELAWACMGNGSSQEWKRLILTLPSTLRISSCWRPSSHPFAAGELELMASPNPDQVLKGPQLASCMLWQ